MRLRFASITLFTLLFASGAMAEILSSASYTQLGGSFSSSSAARLDDTLPSPSFLGSGATLGEGIPVQMIGAATSLESLIPGFWAIVAGSFDALDADGDGIQAFLDDDDDNDGLRDVVETGTGFFVSETNTGTSPNVADSDGDGFSDGAEVQFGTDPTDSESHPVAAVPALGALGWTALCLAMLRTALMILVPRAGARIAS